MGVVVDDYLGPRLGFKTTVNRWAYFIRSCRTWNYILWSIVITDRTAPNGDMWSVNTRVNLMWTAYTGPFLWPPKDRSHIYLGYIYSTLWWLMPRHRMASVSTDMVIANHISIKTSANILHVFPYFACISCQRLRNTGAAGDANSSAHSAHTRSQIIHDPNYKTPYQTHVPTSKGICCLRIASKDSDLPFDIPGHSIQPTARPAGPEPEFVVPAYKSAVSDQNGLCQQNNFNDEWKNKHL